MLGRDRLENVRFIALRSHYGFDSFFCHPGIAGAHEKGGVEGEVGRFRRRHLVPVPVLASLADLNAFMAAADQDDNDRRITGRLETVGAAAARELPGLRALPADAFDPGEMLSCRVDAKARICVRQSYYSVPAHLAGARVSVALGARSFLVRDARPGRPALVVAEHTRSLHKNTQTLVLDHYLEVLARRPGALPAATALAGARAAGLFTADHDAFWAAARRQHGDAAGTRVLIEILLLHRRLPTEAVLSAMATAVRLGRLEADLVAIDARRHLEPTPHPAAASDATRDVGQHRGAPTLHGYDALLEPLGESA